MILKIDDIHEVFDLREGLVQDRVTLLIGKLKEENHGIPLIKVGLLDGQYVLVDGRHRIDAYRKLYITEVEVILSNNTTFKELYKEALLANQGGPLPHSYIELMNNVKTLVKLDAKYKEIIDVFKDIMSEEMVKGAITDAKRAITTDSCRDVFKHVSEGTSDKTAEQWCVEYGITYQRYLEQIALDKGERSDKNPKQSFEGLKGSFTKGPVAVIINVFENHISRIEELRIKGKLTEEHLTRYADHALDKVKDVKEYISNKRARFQRRVNAIKNNSTKNLRKAAKKTRTKIFAQNK